MRHRCSLFRILLRAVSFGSTHRVDARKDPFLATAVGGSLSGTWSDATEKGGGDANVILDTRMLASAVLARDDSHTVALSHDQVRILVRGSCCVFPLEFVCNICDVETFMMVVKFLCSRSFSSAVTLRITWAR